MELKELLQLQNLLHNCILAKQEAKFAHLSKEQEEKQVLVSTILALNVEVGELANELKGDGFKYWSNKLASPREVVLEELVDVYHFVLSLTNQLHFTANDVEQEYLRKNKINYERQNNNY